MSPGKTGSYKYKKNLHQKRLGMNPNILIFNQTRTPKEVKVGYCLVRVEQYVPAPLKCFKCQKYGHHREACKGRHHVPNAVKRTRTTWRKILRKKFDVQTADKITRLTQDLALFTNTGNNLGETQEDGVLPGSKENCWGWHGRKQLRLCCTEGG